MTLDPQRRSALLARKLGALVRDHVGEAPVVLGPFALGSALRRGDETWVLVEDQPARGLGPVLAWVRQQSWTGPLNVLIDDAVAASVVARRGTYFDEPIHVWRIDGRSLTPAEPAPLLPEPEPDRRALALVTVIREAGADPTIEFGVVSGEVGGLEVCRVAIDDHGAYLEVGIGRNDREAFALMHGARPTVEEVRRVVETIAVHRVPDAAPHALNRIARERALRSFIVREPASVEAVVLEPAAPPVPRVGLKESVPCVARGIDTSGGPIVVVCSTGVDLDLVPFAADARCAAGGGDLVIAVPSADRHPVTLALAERVVPAARVVAVDPR